MRKVQFVTITLLVALMISAVAIPFGNAVTASQENNVNQRAFHFQPYIETVNFNTYTGGGFLYNNVAEFRAAYDLQPLYAPGNDGTGQTVVIIDAFGSPTIYDDLLSFIQWQNQFAGANLPWTTMADVKKHLTIYYPDGQPTFDNADPNQLGWSQEVTLDVDMVHAIAPGANIALVIAPIDDPFFLVHAVQYAVSNQLGSVISQSWGLPEFAIYEAGDVGLLLLSYGEGVYSQAAANQITVFASAGDSGAANQGVFNNPSCPASDPLVTAVGGTNLFMKCTQGFKEGTRSWFSSTVRQRGVTYNYEIAGNDYEAMVADGYPAPSDIVTTGGAMSMFFLLPSWQQGITITSADGTLFTPTARCVSDVSFDSGVYGGLGAMPWSAATPGSPIYLIAGGTSMGPPFWAALIAIANQRADHSLGYINPLLYANRATFYKTGAFNDITKGDNTYPTSSTPIGYEATKGWDAPTGIGTADALKIVHQLT